MIITIQGTQKNHNDAAKVVAALSYVGVAKDKMQTLVLQFGNKSEKSVENYLYGRNLRNESLVQDAEVTDITNGMDVLYIHACGGALSRSVFSESTRNVVNIENMYDVAASSKKDSFEKEFVDRELNSIDTKAEDELSFLGQFLEEAKNIYNLIYILLPSENKRLCKLFKTYADVNLICIKQGRKEPVTLFDKKNLYVVTDYCQGSKFNDKALKKEYGVENLYGLMHNVAFSDACADGTLLGFLQKNLSLTKTDSNFSFSSQLMLLFNSIIGNSKKKSSAVAIDSLEEKDIKVIEPTWEPLESNAVKIEVTKISGGFSKPKESSRLVIDENEKNVNNKFTFDKDEGVEDISESLDNEIPNDDSFEVDVNSVIENTESFFNEEESVVDEAADEVAETETDNESSESLESSEEADDYDYSLEELGVTDDYPEDVENTEDTEEPKGNDIEFLSIDDLDKEIESEKEENNDLKVNDLEDNLDSENDLEISLEDLENEFNTLETENEVVSNEEDNDDITEDVDGLNNKTEEELDTEIKDLNNDDESDEFLELNDTEDAELSLDLDNNDNDDEDMEISVNLDDIEASFNLEETENLNSTEVDLDEEIEKLEEDDISLDLEEDLDLEPETNEESSEEEDDDEDLTEEEEDLLLSLLDDSDDDDEDVLELDLEDIEKEDKEEYLKELKEVLSEEYDEDEDDDNNEDVVEEIVETSYYDYKELDKEIEKSFENTDNLVEKETSSDEEDYFDEPDLEELEETFDKPSNALEDRLDRLERMVQMLVESNLKK